MSQSTPHAPGGASSQPEETNLTHLRSDPLESDPLAGISPRRQAFSRRVVRLAEGMSHFFGRHWLALINSALGIFLGGAFLAPIFAYFGNYGASSWLIHTYHGICDQIPSHSYYLFGHQVCLCERCLAIYTTLFLAGLALVVAPRLRSLVHPLDWRLWLLLILPMAIDGGTQLLGWRESDLLLRNITGFLFGLGSAWLILPRLQEIARDMAAQPAAQKA